MLLMKRYKKIYLEYFGYGEQDHISSEYSGLPAVDIHHLIFRSHGGPDKIWNLMALTRDEHEKADRNTKFNAELKEKHIQHLQIYGFKWTEELLQALRQTNYNRNK